ncbi:hypothetical protein BEK98_27740 [Streptomyces diastatochromogenes]|uniref:Secreted protein n=1 Tax=Streptomyces diastatochromogenes TaxID=42236 RepID=A0A233S8I3_STRDA|nr:hypothetical protein BEK98_27740 [Streptomyces diastatochromogenes]
MQVAVVVALVAVQFAWPSASWAATGAYGRDAADQRDEGLVVVEVAAEIPIDRGRLWWSTLRARTLTESIAHRDQY